jgi:hypothetical protein
MPKTHRRPQHNANQTNTIDSYPLHHTSQSPTTAKEKKPRLLWEEQTRDAPAKVKKTASAKPCARRGARCADDQHRETPHRPHDTRLNTLKVAEHSKPPLRLSAARLRPARSTKSTTFRDRRPDIPPLALELQGRANRQPVAQATQGSRPQATTIAPTHPRPPPRHKSQPPPLGRVDRADYPAALTAKVDRRTHVTFSYAHTNCYQRKVISDLLEIRHMISNYRDVAIRFS